nr:protein NRT1/ PTR FAMILY 5.5-like [Quercus suber]XP_023919456.1 protein NRT1/ PTR FAMILY 5.5-like [Quercus suber]XP_023919457.1 protein NRT1/ PTR FAMILY 5.5-like [Quercus suber]POF01626.1 protein nrt1/ ptr family 5.5 [Quercus suber]
MASFVRITVLTWADMLTAYALFVMTPYLINVWKLNITRAAAIVNVFSGVATIMPIGMAFLVDAFMGDYWMLLLSSIAYSFGLSFLAMSTPHVLPDAARNCDAHKPGCIGDAQKILFYAALALIAIGIAGHITSLESFLKQHMEENPTLRKVVAVVSVIIFPIVGCIALPYIKPWSVRFGIPAICTVVATFLFTTGSRSYSCSRPPGSLRCLDKAAIEVQTQNQEQIEQSRWMVIRMIPMWMTFIMCGVVISIGNTYFLDQANDMNRKLGKLKVPLLIFKFFYDLVKEKFHEQYVKVTKKLMIRERYVPPIGIFVAMLFSILCCITAARVETRRLDMISRHLLLDKLNDSNEKIPMSMFWLLPQFLLLGAVEGMSNFSIDQFFTNQAPASMSRYSKLFRHGVIGTGTVGSVLSVYVVGKFSERGGRTNWFQDTLNKSRLDNYYWTLTVLSSINLFLYILVALQYTYRDPPDEDAD